MLDQMELTGLVQVSVCAIAPGAASPNVANTSAIGMNRDSTLMGISSLTLEHSINGDANSAGLFNPH
jgi:hypothetical protein